LWYCLSRICGSSCFALLLKCRTDPNGYL